MSNKLTLTPTTSMDRTPVLRSVPVLTDNPWLLPALLVLIGFLPMLLSFFRQQFALPQYQAFPIMLAAAATFLYFRLRQAPAVNREHWVFKTTAWLLVALSWAILATSFYVFSPWLAMVAFVLYCLAVAICIWQYWHVGGLWGIWLLIALLVPPPLDRDEMFIERLQLLSSRVTSLMMDSIGVLHVAQGNTITLSDRELFVDQACSGIVSLISIVYCIAIYSLWQYRSIVHLALLVVVGVAWTVLMNSLRLLVIALAWAWYKVDLIAGWPHTLLGLIIFSISALVIYTVDRFLLALLAPIHIPTAATSRQRWSVGRALVQGWNLVVASGSATGMTDEIRRAGNRPQDTAGEARPWGRRESAQAFLSPKSIFGLPATAAFAALGVVFFAVFLPSETSQQSNIKLARGRAVALNADSPIVPNSEWELVSFSSDRREIFRWDNWGQYSRTYNLQDKEGFTYQLSCDFMFGPHWHDLRACYRGSGWRIHDEVVLEYDKLLLGTKPVIVDSSLTAPPMVEQFKIRRVPDVLDGLITYGAFRANGQWFNRPRGQGLWNDFVAHVVQGRDRAEQADYFQVQVTTFYEGEINPEQKRRSEWLLHYGTEWFRDHLTKPE